jgi:hypothetical protein
MGSPTEPITFKVLNDVLNIFYILFAKARMAVGAV